VGSRDGVHCTIEELLWRLKKMNGCNAMLVGVYGLRVYGSALLALFFGFTSSALCCPLRCCCCLLLLWCVLWRGVLPYSECLSWLLAVNTAKLVQSNTRCCQGNLEFRAEGQRIAVVVTIQVQTSPSNSRAETSWNINHPTAGQRRTGTTDPFPLDTTNVGIVEECKLSSTFLCS
jgi:hypothetical protein